jgi:hypothetical protein
MSEKLRSYPISLTGAISDDAILGISIATTGEALGHRILFDQVSLSQLQQLGSSKASGVKSRFTHPDWFSDGLGKYLGRVRNFRVEGEKLVADLMISKAAHSSPVGNIAQYVLDLAREDPTALGVSVVVDLDRVWVTADGQELPASGGRPAGATGQYPVARITSLYAADVVDEPALNPDGLFKIVDPDIKSLFTEEEYQELFKDQVPIKEKGEEQEMTDQVFQERLDKIETNLDKLSKSV